MNNDPIRGSTIRFHFTDGAMANKTFEHVFSEDGSVAFRMVDEKAVGGSADASPKEPIRYEVAPIRDGVCAVSYLSKGYTLTTILDFKTKSLVAFSSNEKMVSAQHGTFEAAPTHASHAHPAESRPH